REYWPLLSNAAGRLPAAGGAGPGEDSDAEPVAASLSLSGAEPEPGIAIATNGSCTDFTPQGYIEGTITGHDGNKILIGSRYFRVDSNTNVQQFVGGDLGLDYLKRGASVKVYAHN